MTQQFPKVFFTVHAHHVALDRALNIEAVSYSTIDSQHKRTVDKLNAVDGEGNKPNESNAGSSGTRGGELIHGPPKSPPTKKAGSKSGLKCSRCMDLRGFEPLTS
jgi:hypothetical protein